MAYGASHKSERSHEQQGTGEMGESPPVNRPEEVWTGEMFTERSDRRRALLRYEVERS